MGLLISLPLRKLTSSAEPIGVHILHTVLYTFPRVLVRRIFLTIRASNECEYMNIIYLNCGFINGDESDLRSNERY